MGSAPEIYAFARPYWDAFHLASRRRPWYVGMGGSIPGAIPIETIRAVAPLFGFATEDLEFVQVIDAMDVEWLDSHSKQRASASSDKKPSHGR